jgi:hypothetical protein
MPAGVVLLGMPRSGSTLAFNLARELILHESNNEDVLARFADSEALDSFLVSALHGRQPFVLKSHKLGPLAQSHVVTGEVATIYTWRDPRDAIASHMVFFGSSFVRAMNDVSRSLTYFENDWKGHCLEIAYPELWPLSHGVVLKIAEYLKIDCTDDFVRRLLEKYSFERMHEFTRRHENFAGKRGRYLQRAGHKVTTVGEWHEGHLQSGAAGSWRKTLTAEEIRVLEASWLKRYFVTL